MNKIAEETTRRLTRFPSQVEKALVFSFPLKDKEETLFISFKTQFCVVVFVVFSLKWTPFACPSGH